MIILKIYLIDDTQDGYTALHYAVSKGHYDCAQLLIQAGAVVDNQDNVSTLDVHTVYHHDHTHDISF
jgi:ankyrin repeat protein